MYNRIAIVSVGVMAVLLFFMLSARGMLPFGLSAYWGDYGIGESFIFTAPELAATVGDTLVGKGELQGMAHLYTVKDVVFESDTVYYQVISQNGSAKIERFEAQKLGRSVVFTLPVFGVFVRLFVSTSGMLVFVGLLLSMLIMQVLMRIGGKSASITQGVNSVANLVLEKVSSSVKSIKTAGMVRRSVQETKKKIKIEVVRDISERSVVQNVSGPYVTVLKPYGVQ